MRQGRPLCSAAVQAIVVIDVQLEVVHTIPASSELVDESEAGPKLRPLIVTRLPPLCITLGRFWPLTTGASKLSRP